MHNGLAIYFLVPPPDREAESPGFSTGVEFHSHSSFGQVLGSLDLRA